MEGFYPQMKWLMKSNNEVQQLVFFFGFFIFLRIQKGKLFRLKKKSHQ